MKVLSKNERIKFVRVVKEFKIFVRVRIKSLLLEYLF